MRHGPSACRPKRAAIFFNGHSISLRRCRVRCKRASSARADIVMSITVPKRAAEGFREATAKEVAKKESKTGQDLAKGADRFEERSKSSDENAQKKNKKGKCTAFGDF